MPKVVFISDTHNFHAKIKIPSCDILVHSGDATGRGTLQEVSSFLYWFSQQPAKHKVFVAGNHDHLAERDSSMLKMLLSERPSITYLENSSAEVMGLKFWGSPWTLKYGNWAFMGDEELLKSKFEMMPEKVDIIVCHGPPHGILDLTSDGIHAGSKSLRHQVIDRARPKVVCFGHIHEGYGTYKFGDTLYINASICNGMYSPINLPITLEI